MPHPHLAQDAQVRAGPDWLVLHFFILRSNVVSVETLPESVPTAARYDAAPSHARFSRCGNLSASLVRGAGDTVAFGIPINRKPEQEKAMSDKLVRLTVDLTVNEGQLDEFKNIAQIMIERTRSEPGTLGYEWFLSSDNKKCRLLETYANAEAVLAHFTGPVVQEMVPKLAAVCSVDGFEVYGDPGKEATELIAGFGAEILQPWLGLNH
jgi:quinol monooxygenase YgiN